MEPRLSLHVLHYRLFADNEINFIGVPTRCPVFADIMPLARPRIMVPQMYPTFGRKNSANNEELSTSSDTKRNSSGSAAELRCVCENFFKEYNEQKNQSKAIPVFPQLHIRYVDKAIISNEDYAIGIFHVQVTGLFEIHQRDLRVRVKVLADELDAGTYKSLMVPSDNKSVTFVGCKNGNKQTLRLTGKHIIKNADESFSVSFFEENEDVALTVNMEEDDSDTEIAKMDRDIMEIEYDSWDSQTSDMEDDSSSDSDFD